VKCETEKSFCFGARLGLERSIISDDRQMKFDPKVWFNSGRIHQHGCYRGMTQTHHNIVIENSFGIMNDDLCVGDEFGKYQHLLSALRIKRSAGMYCWRKDQIFGR
jgi:hypothetical protein